MVYYHKLWAMMEQKNITQKQLMERTGVSSATLTKMRKGEYVSLEVIDKIRVELGCGFGELLTSVPPEDKLPQIVHSGEKYEKANAAVREALVGYMKNTTLSVSDISRNTGLSVNTVKSLLNGNAISAYSLLKLCKLGADFAELIEKTMNEGTEQKKRFCDGNGSKRKKCWASQSVWNPETKQYEHYCAFDFAREQDENGQFFTMEECPHPCNYKEMGTAKSEYEYRLRGDVEYIPAKKGNIR